MNVAQYKEEIATYAWSNYAGPTYYEPTEVIEALIALITLDREDLNQATYDKVLFAIGNNHAGTYYPVIEKALTYIINVARHSASEVARNCSFAVLIDLYASFEPELGSYNKITADELENKVKKAIESMQDSLRAIRHSISESDRNKQLVSALLDLINEVE